MYASRLVPLILIVASAACHRSDGGGGGLAIVDTLTGTVVEEWPAPPLTFDVAEDPVTGRVWAVAEHPEDDIARVWELTADGSIPQYELHPGEGGPGGTGYLSYSKYRWLDSGAIALDSGRRRGTFGSSGSDERVILDLDTGERVNSISSYYWGWPIGATFDTASGIGFASTISILYSFETSSGVLAGEYCPDHWVKAPTFNAFDRKVYFISGESSISVLDPATGACGPPLYHLCNGYPVDCEITGPMISHDGTRLYVAAPSLDDPVVPWDGLPSFSIWDLTAPDLEAPSAQTEFTNGAAPHGFAISPDDSTLYVTMVRCRRIGVYDARTGEHFYDIPMHGETMGIDLSADGSRLYVTQVARDGVLSPAYSDDILRERAGPCPPLKERE